MLQHIWLNSYVLCLYSGYEGLTQNLIEELPAGLVTYNKPVRCVNWNSAKSAEPVMIECDGQKLIADHVIVTVPLGKFHTHKMLIYTSVYEGFIT